METLIFSLKFFTKIIALAIGSYMWSGEATEESTESNHNVTDNQSIEIAKTDIVETSMSKDTLVLDSLDVTKIVSVENNIEI